MNDLISRESVLKNIEKIRQSVQMMDDTHRASITMSGMYLCEKAVRNQPSAQSDLCDGCDRYGASCVGEGCGKLEMPEVAKDTNVPNNDCISRQSVIDAFSKYDDTDLVKAKYVRQAIEDLPSAQPEIIYCKDCKYCDRGIDEDGNPFLKCLGWVYGGTQEEDFCSHYERRTDD